ncbi:MAG TPA: surface-adhesin E family protein [Burkholderiales bacterium]|nr:surface-adhesin E family protein [Burkholderiales bacterium]
MHAFPKIAFVLVLGLLAAAGSAFAARWKPVSINPERAIFIDVEALARNGNTVQAWDWQKFSAPQTSATWQGSFYWVKSLTNYHCTLRTTDPVLKIYFSEDGVEVKRTNLEGLQFPAMVEPDSLRERLLETACNPPKAPAKASATKSGQAAKTDGAADKEKAMAGMDAAKPDKAEAEAKPEQKETSKPDKKEAKKPEADKAVSAEVKHRPRTGAIAPVVYHRTYTLPPRVSPKKAGTSKAARSAKRDPSCPPAAAAGPPKDAPAQLTEAGSDGLFN